MKKVNPIIIENWNKTADGDWMRYRTDECIQKIIDDPYSVFHPVTLEVIKNAMPELKGKKVCVPSSGDNHAVFAFHLLGAKVTSCDISPRQLEHAETIAKKHGWDIEFIIDNTMTLERLGSEEYDFVFTSNGVHVWIDDLPSMYESIHRVLKKSGVYVMYEIHPISRPMEDCLGEVRIRKPYGEIGPYYETNYHWRAQDFVNAIAGSGLCIKRMEEMFDQKETGGCWFNEDKRAQMTREEIDIYYDWHTNPQAAFPQWLSICAAKPE